MFFTKLAVLLISAAVLAGCGTTPRQQEMQALRSLEQTDFSKFVSGTDGLTRSGCAAFFPAVDADLCHTEWHAHPLVDKFVYLKEKASPMMRGLWEDSRNTEFAEAMRKKDPQMTAVEIQNILDGFGTALASQCAKEAGLHEDECIFAFGTFATPLEIAAAYRDATALRADERFRQSALLNHMMMRSVTRSHMRPALNPPKRRR